MWRAVEQIRRMRGGAQSHLMRCVNEHGGEFYYVVKFQNNPQHRRVLVNELLGTRLAAKLGLPTTPAEIVEVSGELIRLTPELVIELPRSRVPCQAGRQFGSRFPGDPRRTTLYDFLPDEQLRVVENVHEFAGMLVFDKWTCNTNGRQTLFCPKGASGSDEPANTPQPGDATSYTTKMIDQGFCFNAGEWNYPDAPLRGLYSRNRVYEGVTGMESFRPWLERIEKLKEPDLEKVVDEVPPEWYEDDYDGLQALVERLYRRRKLVPDLILAAKKTTRQPFPNWR
jgi:hypothetical protein